MDCKLQRIHGKRGVIMNTLKDFVNWKLTHADKTAKAEGYPLVLENCKANKKMKQLLVYGNGDGVGDFDADGKYKISVVQKGKNLFKPTAVSALSIRSNRSPTKSNSYGTNIDATDLTDNKVVVTQTSDTNYTPVSYYNGYFFIQTSGLVIGKQYNLSFDLDIKDNPLGATYISVLSPNGLNQKNCYFKSAKQRVKFTYVHTDKKNTTDYPFVEIRCMGMSFTASNFMITEQEFDDSFEPYAEPAVQNVFLNEPLKDGEYIDFTSKKVIKGLVNEAIDCKLPTIISKTTIFEIETTSLPSNMRGKYIKN